MDPIERIVRNELAMARTSEAYERADTKAAHVERAKELVAKADEWLDVDMEELTVRGYGLARTRIELAKLHLALRELL